MMRRPSLPMAPASFTAGLALALFLVPSFAAAGPSLSGFYRAEPYGKLEMKTEGAHVTGTLVSENPCNFPPPTQVLMGDFEGSVLVARLRVCQTGDMCPAEQFYTVLGFYNSDDNTVVAYVRLRDGCQSSALPKSGRFVLGMADKTVPEETPTSSATAAVLDANTRRAAMLATRRGEELYQLGQFAEAVKSFTQSIDLDGGTTSWSAYFGRGMSQLRQGKADLAIKDLEKARARTDEPRIFYGLACAYAAKRDKVKALDFLGRAVAGGYDLENALANKELVQALGNDPKFKEWVKISSEKKSRGTAAGGNTSP
jgi:tetratricopeptide (TPR) repeat protein